MKQEIKNQPASIHDQLNRMAKETGRPFMDVFYYYAMERFLYRLSQSPYCSRFILKGGLAFLGWGIPLRRPTRDIDFQAYVDNSIEEIVNIVKEVCNLRRETEDGMTFDPASITGSTIMQNADYQGVRVRFKAYLARAYLWLQMDVSFANVITPKEMSIEYPTLLNMPGFRLKSYSPETTIAEKLHAMVILGSFNDRMKDFYDIYLLSQMCDFEGPVLVQAITSTFANRKTDILFDNSVLLSDGFAAQKQANWQQFVKGVNVRSEELEAFNVIIAKLREFLGPPFRAAAIRESFPFEWKAGKVWEPQPE